MRPLLLSTLAATSACTGTEPGEAIAYSDACKQEAPGVPIADASGSFEVTGRDDAPQQWGVGTWTGGTGSLNVYTCVASQESDLLDALTLDLELVLFEIDDQPVDLEVGSSDTVNVLWGTVWDIEGITDWTTEGSFVNFADGSSSFSELDKEGRLVGTIEVTQTDPPGPPLTIDVDLSW